MDLSKLSTEDLKALQAGDLSKVSTQGLMLLQNGAPKEALPALERFAHGAMDPVHGGAQLLTKLLPDSVVQAGNAANNWLADKTGLVAPIPEGGVDQMVRQREAEYQSHRSPEQGWDVARFAGNVASPVNLTLARLAPGVSTLPGRMAVGGVLGAASGATAPVTGEGDFGSEKLKQVGIGLAGGSVLPAVAAGLGRLISPAASRNPDVAMLKSEGVAPTIGQTLGGWANAVEEKAQSLPIIGDAIAAARGRARDQFNQAALNRAGAPVGAKASGSGQEAVAEIGDKISAAYDAAKTQLGSFQLDRTAASQLAQIKSMAANLGPREQAAFQAVWDRLDAAVSQNGTVRAEAFKMFDSKAGQEAARFQGSPDVYQQQVGDAIKQLQTVVLDAAKRANPTAAKAFDKADEAWANLVRVEGASKAAMNSGGVFTPAQLQQAVRAADTSVRDRATARGQALLQDLSGAGQRVLGNRVPDSGTAGRMFLGGGALATGAVAPSIPVGLLAGAATYTPPVQALLRGLVSSRPALAEPVRGLLNESAPMLAPAGGLLALDSLSK